MYVYLKYTQGNGETEKLIDKLLNTYKPYILIITNKL